MADPSLLPGDMPSSGGIVLGAAALGGWLWTIFRKVKVDVNTDKLFEQGAKDRVELRERIKELEIENKDLNKKMIEMSGTSGGASASAMQLQQRLLKLERTLRDAEISRDQERLTVEDAERTIDMLTIHLVRLSFYMDTLKGNLPENSLLQDLVIDLPEVLEDIKRRQKETRNRAIAKPEEEETQT